MNIEDIRRNLLKSVGGFEELLTGSAVTLCLRAIGLVVGYGMVFMMSKVFGPEGVGFYQTMLQTLNVLGILLALGMNVSILRYVGQFYNSAEQSKLHLLSKYALQILGPISIVAGLIIFFLSDGLASSLGKSDAYALGLKLVALALPFFTINKVAVEFIRGAGKLQISELIRSVLRPVVMVVGLCILFQFKYSTFHIICVLVAAVAVKFLFASTTIHKLLRTIPRTSVTFSRKELMRTSFPMMGSSLAGALLLALPVIFIDYWGSQSAVGIYSVAWRLAFLVSMFLLIIDTVVAPKLSKFFWADKKAELQKTLSQSTRLVFWSSLFGSIGLVLCGKWLLGLFGIEFVTGFWVLVVLSIGNALSSSFGSAGVLLNMIGEQRASRGITIGVAILSVFLYFRLGSSENLLIFAAIDVGGKLVINLLSAVVAWRSHRIWTFVVPNYWAAK